MNLYKYNNQVYLFYKDKNADGHCVKIQTQDQLDWVGERLGGVFYGMCDNDPEHPSDESFINKITKLWPEDERANIVTQKTLKDNGYINISDVTKQMARDSFSAVVKSIEKIQSVTMATNASVMVELFNHLADMAAQYDLATGTDKYEVFIMACKFMSADPNSSGIAMINMLRSFASYPNFLDASAVKSAPCGCGSAATGLTSTVSGLCDISSMWRSWMLNILFWYLTNAEFWLDIKPFTAVDGVYWVKLTEILSQLHLGDYSGCSCKDLSSSYTITSADILRWLSLLAMLGDCPTNNTFMWRTLSIMIFTQLFSVLYIQNTSTPYVY